MTSKLNIDKIYLSSAFGAFTNYKNSTSDINVTAITIPDGGTASFSTSINYDRASTVMDIYASNGSVKTLVSGGRVGPANIVYTNVSSEVVSLITTYTQTNVNVELKIRNYLAGSSITLIAQTITIDYVQYQIPITPL